MRILYTAKEDEHLLKYIAEVRPLKAGRQGKEIYQNLVSNPEAWPWARTHSWQGWRDHYKANQDEFDERIARYQRRHNINPEEKAQLNAQATTQRMVFTDDEDKILVKYLAKYHPQLRGRSGNQTYKKLTENAEGRWNWSRTHPWQSWRHRYVSNQERFDREIAKYQARHNIPIPIPSSQVERPAKRLKVAADDTQETQWAKLDWTSRKDHTPNGSTAQNDEQEEKKPVVVEGKKPVVVKQLTPDKPPPESTTADEDQADESDDEGGPPASEDYVGEIFPESDKDENGDEQVSATEDEAEDENIQDADSGAVRLNGSTSTAAPTHEKPASASALNIPVPSQSNLILESEPASSHPLPRPSQPKPRAAPSYHDFTFSSQYKRYHPHPNDDPFEDHQSPPKSPRKTQLVEKSPPKIVEGPFGNRLRRARIRKSEDNPTESDNDGGIDAPWPPPRGTMAKLPIRNGAHAQPRKPRGGYLNGIVTEEPRRDKGKGKAREYDESDFPPEVHGPASPVAYENEPNSRQAIPALPQSKTTAAQGPLLGPGPSQASTLKRRRTDIFLQPPPSNALTPKRYSTGDITNHPPPPTHPPPASTHTNLPSHSRIINFRRELSNNTLVHQRASSRSSRASSIIITPEEEDNQIFQQLGMQQAMRLLSEQFGFTEAIVQKLWNQLKSLRLLKDALTEMRDSADRTMNEWIEGASRVEGEGGGSGGGQSPTIGSGVFQVAAKTRTAVTPSVIMTTPSSIINDSSRPSSSKRRGRGRQSNSGTGMKSLEIKPVDAQDVSVAMELEYEPLTGTRAGKYTRLAKMGREDEALEREQRRVSSIALSPRRDLLQQDGQEQGQEQEQEEEQDVEREEVEEIVAETQDEDEEIRDEDDVYGVRPDEEEEEEGRDDRSDDEQDDGHAMEVDSTPPDVHEQRPTIHPDNVEHGQEMEHDSDLGDRRGARIVHEERHKNDEPQSQVENLDEGEQMISSNADSPRKREAKPPTQTDNERWKEAEPLFRAASRGNVEVLKELERTFNPGFLMEWLGSLVALKQ